MTQNWTPIKIQFRILLNLGSLIFAPNNSLDTQTCGAKLDSNLEFNWIFSQFWILIYTSI